jgi:hypothetical protein
MGGMLHYRNSVVALGLSERRLTSANPQLTDYNETTKPPNKAADEGHFLMDGQIRVRVYFDYGTR